MGKRGPTPFRPRGGTVRVEMLPGEREMVKCAARKVGLSMSEWMRQVAVRAAKQQRGKP